MLFFFHSIESFTSTYWVPIQTSSCLRLLHNTWLHCACDCAWVHVCVSLCVRTLGGTVLQSWRGLLSSLLVFVKAFKHWDHDLLKFKSPGKHNCLNKGLKLVFTPSITACILTSNTLNIVCLNLAIMSLASDCTLLSDILNICQVNFTQIILMLRQIILLWLLTNYIICLAKSKLSCQKLLVSWFSIFPWSFIEVIHIDILTFTGIT